MGIRMKTPELSLESRILYTTRMRQLPSLPSVQYSRPIPPCVRMRPSSTVMLPGPTCFQPVRSLPLKSGFHAGGCDCAVAMAKRTGTTATSSVVTHLREFMACCSSGKSSQARGARHGGRPYKGKSKLEFAQVVVADFYVVEG